MRWKFCEYRSNQNSLTGCLICGKRDVQVWNTKASCRCSSRFWVNPHYIVWSSWCKFTVWTEEAHHRNLILYSCFPFDLSKKDWTPNLKIPRPSVPIQRQQPICLLWCNIRIVHLYAALRNFLSCLMPAILHPNNRSSQAQMPCKQSV
jgi:hypothetical protein